MSSYINSDQEAFDKYLKELLAEIGLQNFRLDNVRLAGEPKIVARIWKEIEIKERDFHPGNFHQLIPELIQPIADDIKNSPVVASIRALHAEEMQSLRNHIQMLEEQNMKLSGANEQLEKMVIGKIPDKQPES